MTIVHRRSMGLLPGRLGAYTEVARELQAYHRANGVEYEFQIPFGNDPGRVAIASRYGTSSAIEKYYRKVMADPTFQQLAGRSSQHVVAESVNDDFWRIVLPPPTPATGALLYARVMGILPGRLGATMAMMKELVEYFGSIGANSFCVVPAGTGDPMRCALAGRYTDVATLEALGAKIMGDARWHELIGRNAVNMVPGSMRDEMWLTI